MTFRTDSLARKLQEFKEDGRVPIPSKLDELMIFLEDPPKEGDRFKLGAALVNGWGVKCGRSAVWSLYRSYALLWRMAVANAAAQTTEELSSFEEKIRNKAAQRTYETLSDPELSPKILVGLARIEFQKQALQHDREKLKAALRTKLESAMEAIKQELDGNPAAMEAFDQMLAALEPKKS
jgi:hypothetical protein